MGDPLQKAQDRLSLHELIRIGVGRQEDLRLLQNVAMQAACLPAASVAQLLREAALREEWRSGREAALLASLRSQSLGALLGLGPEPGGCRTTPDGRLLSEQVAALTEMLEQQQQQRRRRGAPASGPGPGLRAGGSLKSISTTPGSAPLRPYLGSPGGKPPPSPQQLPRPASTPVSASGRVRLSRTSSSGADGGGSGYYDGSAVPMTQQQLPRQGSGTYTGGSSSAAAAAIYGASTAAGFSGSGSAVVGSPARALRVGGRGAGGAQQRGLAHSPQGKLTHGSSPGQTRTLPRPGSAPEELAAGTWSAARAAGLEPAAAASAAAAAAAASAVNTPAAPASGGSSTADGPHRTTSRFRNLLRLQQLLLQGLREHAQDEGEGGALEALASSVAEAQAFFAECLGDALEAAGLPPDTVPLPGQGQGRGAEAPGGRGGPGSPTRRLPGGPSWDKMLRLGQLGLTRSDVARLEEIRRQRAARVIQRQVRRWLRRRWHQRRLAEARARADAMMRKLCDRAARVIQSWVRGHLARRLAAQLAAQAAAERAQRRRAKAAREAAAVRIQRAWRAHRRKRRYAAALARAEQLRLQKSPPVQMVVMQQQQQQQQQSDRGVAGGAAAAGKLAAASRSGSGSRSRSSMTVEQAVVVIQSHLRGWLVRRSSALWWARASRGLRERRAAVRAWQHHSRFMAASYPLQAQLLGALVREAQVAEALAADQRRQETEMKAAFNEWLLQQQRVALSQPLPRGWVPHPHPEQPGRTCFLNTRTGELHALHPVVADLARFAREQQAAAGAALQQRFAGVPAYLQRLHEATAAQAAIAMRAIALVHHRTAAGQGQGQGQGPAGPAAAVGAVGSGSAPSAAPSGSGSGSAPGSGSRRSCAGSPPRGAMGL